MSLSLSNKNQFVFAIESSYVSVYNVTKGSTVDATFRSSYLFNTIDNLGPRTSRFKCFEACNQDNECKSIVRKLNSDGSYTCLLYSLRPEKSRILTEASSNLWVKIEEEDSEPNALIADSIAQVSGNRISFIHSDFRTYFGRWYPVYSCPVNSYTIGFSIKVDTSDIYSDNTGLNSIRLICNDSASTRIQSGEGWDGQWGNEVSCQSGNKLHGFRFKSEFFQFSKDDTAANGLKMICENGVILTPSNESPYGSWESDKYCPTGQVICGIQTQIQSFQNNWDDSSLNNVYFQCCSI